MRKIEQAGGGQGGALRVSDPPDRAIVRLGKEIGAELIVMGSRGPDRMQRVLLSSVSDTVVRHAHCPVLVVPESNDAAV